MIFSSRKIQATLLLVAATGFIAEQRSALGFGMVCGRRIQSRAFFLQTARKSILLAVAPSLGADSSEAPVSVPYESDGMPILPKEVVKYSQAPKTGAFTGTSVPVGLLKDHSTKAGTWGVICVSKGSLEYTIHEPKESVHVLTPGTQFGIIEPTRLHHVSPLSDDTEFVVEFHRSPGTGPVDEKREGYNNN